MFCIARHWQQHVELGFRLSPAYRQVPLVFHSQSYLCEFCLHIRYSHTSDLLRLYSETSSYLRTQTILDEMLLFTRIFLVLLFMDDNGELRTTKAE